MMPAAPLVGAVTTRPPAAFSSFTASAYRFTQSMHRERVAAGGLVAGIAPTPSGPVQRGGPAPDARAARAGTPSSRSPRSMHASIAAQIRSRPASISRVAKRQWRSFRRTMPAMSVPSARGDHQQLVRAAVRERQDVDVRDRTVRGPGRPPPARRSRRTRRRPSSTCPIGARRQPASNAVKRRLLAWNGVSPSALAARLNTRSAGSSNATSCRPRIRRRADERIAASRASIASTSTWSGSSPSRPSRIALSVPCPRPVAPSEP